MINLKENLLNVSNASAFKIWVFTNIVKFDYINQI